MSSLNKSDGLRGWTTGGRFPTGTGIFLVTTPAPTLGPTQPFHYGIGTLPLEFKRLKRESDLHLVAMSLETLSLPYRAFSCC